MPEPINIGGANVYLPEKKGLFAKWRAKRALKYHKEGDMNVIKYNDMTIKYPDQTNVKLGQTTLPAKIYTYNGRTEIALDGAEINGSEKDDKVVSYCTNSIFNFEGGGTDIISYSKKIELTDDRPVIYGCTFNIGEGDSVHSNIMYTYNQSPIASLTDYMTKIDGEMVNEYSDEDYYDYDGEPRMVRTKQGEIDLDADYDDEE